MEKDPVRLAFQCSIKWHEMAGEGKVRQCTSCQCQVQDISDFSEEEVSVLQQRVDDGEKVCVAFKRQLAEPIDLDSFHLLRLSKLAATWTCFLSMSVNLSGCSLPTNTVESKTKTDSALIEDMAASSKLKLQPKLNYYHQHFEHSVGGVGKTFGRKLDSAPSAQVAAVSSLKTSLRLRFEKLSTPELEASAKDLQISKQYQLARECYLILLARAERENNLIVAARLKSTIQKLNCSIGEKL